MFLHRKLSFNSLLLCETKNVVHDPLNLIKRKPTKFIGFYFVLYYYIERLQWGFGLCAKFHKTAAKHQQTVFCSGLFFLFFLF